MLRVTLSTCTQQHATPDFPCTCRYLQDLRTAAGAAERHQLTACRSLCPGSGSQILFTLPEGFSVVQQLPCRHGKVILSSTTRENSLFLRRSF